MQASHQPAGSAGGRRADRRHAASLSKLSREDFEQRASARLGQPLAVSLAAAAEGEFDAGAFRAAIAENLAAARFRLIIAVDEISDELRDAVLYLNEQTKTEFLALELGYVQDSGVEFLVPTVFGEETVERKFGLRQPPVLNPGHRHRCRQVRLRRVPTASRVHLPARFTDRSPFLPQGYQSSGLLPQQGHRT